MFKKTIVLALVAMAVAAVSVPAASAKWTDKGVPLGAGTNPQIQLTGQTLFTSIIGGINCQVDVKAQLTGSTTTGTIEAYEVDLTEAGSTVTSKCVTSGPLATCKLKSLQSTGLPWTLHSNGADVITVTNGQVHTVLENATGGACGLATQEITLEPGSFTYTISAGKTSAISQVTLGGTLKTATGTTITISGTQTIQGTDAGTYGTA